MVCTHGVLALRLSCLPHFHIGSTQAQGMQSHLGFYCHPFGSGCPIDFLCNSLMMLPNSASPMEAASIAC
ncbi:unnamed protein product [Prunus armeniaca]